MHRSSSKVLRCYKEHPFKGKSYSHYKAGKRPMKDKQFKENSYHKRVSAQRSIIPKAIIPKSFIKVHLIKASFDYVPDGKK
jgi:hypothetical protein